MYIYTFLVCEVDLENKYFIQVPGHVTLCPDFSLTGPSGSNRHFPDYPATSNLPDNLATSKLPAYPANTNFPDYPANTNFPDYQANTNFPDNSSLRRLRKRKDKISLVMTYVNIYVLYTHKLLILLHTILSFIYL